ncbi:MAG: TetR family transcriptional regulator [Actinobacteria bacterium]|nr:TetR family transcriptional regulator [Actinomycetota bacterium]
MREGLLPRPAKLAASRSLYSELYVELLRQITELKQAGLSLEQIKSELQLDAAQSSEPGVDLVAREHERIHAEIVKVATHEFATQGYEATHVATIIKKIGTTPHVFYNHFTSKHQLLAECFLNLVELNLKLVEPRLADKHDLAQRNLARLASDFALHAIGSEVVNLTHSEEKQTGDVRKLVAESYGKIVQPIVADLDAVRPSGFSSAVSTELLAYSLLGAFDNTQLRASWDDRYTRPDLFRTHLWLLLAIREGLSGRVDIDSELAKYEESIGEAAAGEPELPLDLE